MRAKVTVLGCGNSSGVPAAGGFWGACNPEQPRNERTRSSIAVQYSSEGSKRTLIVDTGPDFRQQTIRENIQSIDAVLYSHAHGDHINGIDDLRAFFFRNGQRQIPAFASQETLSELQTRFHYIFNSVHADLYPPLLDATAIVEGLTYDVAGLKMQTFTQDHGTCTSTGFRFGNFAYSVDLINLGQEALINLNGIDIWMVDAAGYKQLDNKVHASIEKIQRLNEFIGARRVILTSLSLAMDFDTLCAELPDGYEASYDGQTFEIIAEMSK